MNSYHVRVETNHSQLELLAHPMKAGRRRDSLSTVKGLDRFFC